MTLAAHAVSVSLGGRPVLHDLTLSVAPGELIAVAGANGAGKSTALRVLAGLLAPGEGRVTLEGTPLHALERATLGRNVAYLPQDRTVHWGLSVERIVALGRLPHKRFSLALDANDKAAVEAAMARMDVQHLAMRPVTQLSGGERARVLLARALAQEARFLIADEPAAGLDPAHALSLFEELRRLTGEGKGVVTALHDLSFAARYASRILLFKDGRCIADGHAEAVLSNANLASAFGIDAIMSHVEGLPVFLPRSSLRNTSPLT